MGITDKSHAIWGNVKFAGCLRSCIQGTQTIYYLCLSYVNIFGKRITYDIRFILTIFSKFGCQARYYEPKQMENMYLVATLERAKVEKNRVNLSSRKQEFVFQNSKCWVELQSQSLWIVFCNSFIGCFLIIMVSQGVCHQIWICLFITLSVSSGMASMIL